MVKKIIIAFIAIFCLSAGPNWERVNYRDSTVFSGIVTFNGKPASAGDIVGAFVDKECRMITTVFKNNDSAYVSAVIHGERPELISFKLWVKAEDKVYDLPKTIMSKPSDGIYLFHLDFSENK